MRRWGNRWRRGIVTKNWHWRAAMQARCGNWLLGRGFRTASEYARETENEARQAETEGPGRKRFAVEDATFTIECFCCGRHFKRRSRIGTALKPHKSPRGFACYGRNGFLL